MHWRSLSLVFLLVVTGCGQKPSPEARNVEAPDAKAPKDGPRAEVRIGGPDAPDPGCLPFSITAIHEKQKPSTDAPFHVKGGDWTFFDCQTATDPKVTFTIGVVEKRPGGGTPASWGRAALIVKDRDSGHEFIKLFSKSFPGKIPTPVKRPHVPGPLLINTAILGENLDREEKGGFSGVGGGWTATKWFPEHDGRSGEVFFNYNLGKRRGEFSEKDADYADDLLAVFASALRDGPRPERTPENDPNLVRTGPTIGKPRKLLSRLAAYYSFSPQGGFAVYQNDSTILTVPADKPDGKPFEIARLDHSPWEVHVVDEDLKLLVQEGVPETPGVKSSADPMRIWWVDHKSKEKKLLRGPEKDLNLAGAPLSPDHRYVVLNQWRDKPGKKDRTKLYYILDHESGDVKVIKSPDKDLSFVGWRKTDVGLRAVAVTGRWSFLNKDGPSELYLIDPTTGKLERKQDEDARLDLDNPLSPDGKYRVRVGKDDLIVTSVADGKQRRFVLHEEDCRFVGEESIEWVSPRYLKFNGPRLALIDVITMKMCFPATADGAKFGSHSYKFSPDFRWVLYQGEGVDGEGLFLAPVEMPKE